MSRDTETGGTAREPRPTAARQKVRRGLLLGFLLLFPVTFNYYSPALPIQGTLERVACFSLIFWAAWTGASLVFGRASCGYICPLGGLQEAWDTSVRRKLVRIKGAAAIKYAIFAAWVGAIGLAAVRAGGWERVDLIYQTESYVSWDRPESAVIYAGMFGLVMLLCLPLGRRAFCHYLCWWSPLNILGTKAKRLLAVPSLALRADSGECIKCGTCDRVCQMSLPVGRMVAEGEMNCTECILCGCCVDNCPAGAIHYTWRPRSGSPGRGTIRQERRERRDR